MAKADDIADRLARLYGPIAARIVARRRAAGHGLSAGLCGPQGSGKSTGAVVLRELIAAEGVSAVIVSLDDLYLGRAARQALAARVHPLLATRGPPGTHDVGLGAGVLAGLLREGPTAVPRFDKAADDQTDKRDWPMVAGPADVILFEGWCVGARPQAPAELAAPVNDLEAEADSDGVWRAYVNKALARDYPALFANIGFQILLSAPSFEIVAEWRIEQEHALKASGARGRRIQSDEELRRFVKLYERLTRHLSAEMPSRADVVIRLDEERNPITD